MQNKIRELRKALKLSQSDLSKKLHLHQTAISQWESGRTQPDNANLQRLADFFGVSVDYLLGRDETPANILPVNSISIPMMDSCTGSEPIRTDAQCEAVLEPNADLNCDFALRVDDDSMEPHLQRGDVVFIRQQDDVPDGSIAAVRIADQAALKHVFHIQNGLILTADNQKYAPVQYIYSDSESVQILGLAVAYRRRL